MKIHPLVIAVSHSMPLMDTKEYSEELDDTLWEIARQSEEKKPTIFMEGTRKDIETLANRLQGRIKDPRRMENLIKIGDFYAYANEPFEVAIANALVHGWEVRPLDKQSQRAVKMHAGIKAHKWLGRYLVTNQREKRWAAIVNAYAKPEDIVVLHPNHARGFAKEAGIRGSNILWITGQQRSVWKRLNRLQEFLVRRGRLKERMKRRPEAFKPPTQEQLAERRSGNRPR